MSRPTIEPVTDTVLPEFAAFLNKHLQSSRSPSEWEACLKLRWADEPANHGFVLRDKGEIVGGIGAYYANRTIGGRSVRLCNITSWCVLDAYRQQSMRLAMAVLGQPGWEFTNFTPTAVVASTLKFLKFQEIDASITVLLNLPLPAPGVRVLSRAADIEAALRGEDLQRYRDHVRFDWLRQVVVGREGGWCHVVYKKQVYKGLPSAWVLYVSDRGLFAQHIRRLSAHWLAQGIVTTHVENRVLPRAPFPSAHRSGFEPKLFRSDTLAAADIDYLYSELVALDL